MCGRYTLEPVDQILERFDITGAELELEPNYNVAPTQHMPVVVRNSPNRLEFMQWGLIPFWAKDSKIGYKMINARAESVTDKPSFRKAFVSQRCLVPASGFYEWKKTEQGKVPHFIHLKDEKLFAFAGLYDVWRDEDGREIQTYTIITTEPNELMEDIHDRMPVILRREGEETWIDPEIKDKVRLESLLVPYPAEEMEAYPVSLMVNNPRNNNDSLVEPV
jgi:putative SOS response-associated peptidase YedK